MNTLFLQSETDNPFEKYAIMRKEHPVYWDNKNKIWAVYTYNHCDLILKSHCAVIPQMETIPDGTKTSYARAILKNLVRINDLPEHKELKRAVIDLLRLMQPLNIPETIEKLLNDVNITRLNWSKTVAKRLPITVLLQRLQFQKEDIDFILANIERIKTFMAFSKTTAQIRELCNISEKLYPLVDAHLQKTYPEEALPGKREVYVSNLIGLCIQAYDALRGFLSHLLLHYIHWDMPSGEGQKHYFENLAIETLRFNPVFHHTKRVLKTHIRIGDHDLKKGQQVLLVLASANRDKAVFDHPEEFDIFRNNNRNYLSFSSGVHYCPADHFSIHLGTATLQYLTSRYSRMALQEGQLIYEPVSNARIPENLVLSLSE